MTLPYTMFLTMEMRMKYGWLRQSFRIWLIGRMNSWRIINEDMNRSSVVIEESYYTDVRPESGIYVTFSEYGEEITKPISSIPEEQVSGILPGGVHLYL